MALGGQALRPQQRQRTAQMGDGLGVGRALRRVAGCVLPAGQRLGNHASLLVVQGQQLGPAAAQAAELGLQHGGNRAMQAAAVALQHRLVGGIAHQRMLEAVVPLRHIERPGIGRHRQQAGAHQRVERTAQALQSDRRCGMGIDGLHLGQREGPAQRAAQLRGALGQRQLVQPGHQQIGQRAGHGMAQCGGDIAGRLLGADGGRHAG